MFTITKAVTIDGIIDRKVLNSQQASEALLGLPTTICSY